ncbi:hypothetical protein BSZ36_13960 [Rubricoccus marinus]|uniref:Uncharacterized protein n=2 Tax=Rubricoccus marinus TaxID=716817 RepID=A0A259U215_9BACT|nr:hypothetical protein BSZ36_13960 [Rubricoccus marinus]
MAVLLLGLLPALAACGPSNRLREVSLDQSRIAIVAAIPPHPRVQAGSPEEGAIRLRDPLGSMARVGTAAEKYRQVQRAQARLDSAVARVDVADRIARQVLAQSAETLRFSPAARPSGADFILDLRIRDYALVADSFEGATFFVIEGDLLLLEAATGRELWDGRIQEREVLTGSLFGLPAAAGNVITARALAGLSSAEMATGLDRLADFAAQRVTDRLRRDYARSRDDYERRR